MAIIPTMAPNKLSDNAYALYKRGLGYPYQVRVKTEEEATSAAEIVEAGLGRLSEYDGKTSLSIASTANSLVIVDDESIDVDSRLTAVVKIRSNGDSPILAVLKGARVQFSFENEMPTACVTVTHATGTDAEHDRAYVAQLVILSPIMNSITGHSTSFRGFLTEARLYPAGMDPKMAGDERDGIEPSEVCEDEACDRHVGHPIMPFIPPLSQVKNVPVGITIYSENTLKSEKE